MDLLEQLDLIKGRWQALIKETRDAGVPRHTLLEALAAEVAVVLAEQPEHISSSWIEEVRQNVRELRQRGGAEGES